jgi:septation ring formation regulator EzrA
MNGTTLAIIGTIISAVAVLISALSLARYYRKDDETNSKSFIRVETKIDGMGSQITEVRDDVKAQGVLYSDMRERVRAVEESTKSAHKRIDTLEEKENK